MLHYVIAQETGFIWTSIFMLFSAITVRVTVLFQVARSFKLEVQVDPKYHPKIIGRRGAVISRIRDQNNVQIQFPDRGTEKEDIIAITGYEKDAEAAKEDILRIVHELVSNATCYITICKLASLSLKLVLQFEIWH